MKTHYTQKKRWHCVPSKVQRKTFMLKSVSFLRPEITEREEIAAKSILAATYYSGCCPFWDVFYTESLSHRKHFFCRTFTSHGHLRNWPASHFIEQPATDVHNTPLSVATLHKSSPLVLFRHSFKHVVCMHSSSSNYW